MKIKHQLALFNVVTRLIVILVLWFMLPVLIEKVVYKNINKSLLEKKQKFIKHLDKDEINDFIVRNDATETYASFSSLHSEFIQLSQVPEKSVTNKSVFINENRIIEGEENNYRILQYQFLYENTAYQMEIGSSLSQIEEITFAIKLFVFVVLLIIIVVTFLVDIFFIEYLLKPFYKIIDTKIRRANEPNTFNHKPIPSYSADFQELDTVLNQMMQRIGALFNKEKQFIANVSHELLTPIALLKNKFENLIQNPSLDDNAVDKIASSLKTLDLLKKVISNLLLISRIENNQYEANEKSDFQELIVDLVANLRDRIDDKELQFSIKLLHQFHFVGNQTLLHILFYNLIVNAIKYNVPKGSVVISDGFSDGIYFISFADTGIGMNATQLKNIFNRFMRINSDQEGHGLGLAIAESIANFHAIEIKVTSETKKGTTFYLLFNTKKHN